MVKGFDHSYAFFLGCIAPNRYPGCEASAIRTSAKFGINELLPLKGTSSCLRLRCQFGAHQPQHVWSCMAARNLFLLPKR